MGVRRKRAGGKHGQGGNSVKRGNNEKNEFVYAPRAKQMRNVEKSQKIKSGDTQR